MKTKKFVISLLIVTALMAVLLGACGKQTNGTTQGDEGDQNIAITHIAETAYAAMTETALVNPATPTYTPTFLPSNTPLPTMAASPTPGLATPTATLAVQQPPAGGNNTSTCDVAQFVSDVTIPDGTQVTAGQKFTKTWEIKNAGTCTWNAAYQIVFYGGEQMADETAFALTGKEVAPGDTIEVSIEMTAPSASGEYFSYWVFRNASGQNFFLDVGGSIYVQIKVGSSSTSTPTSTGAPTATPTSTTAANTAPTISITAPGDGSSDTVGNGITFTATASDTEDGDLTSSVVWTFTSTSSGSGSMGTGGSVLYSFGVADTYTVTAKVTDSGSKTATASITITIN